MIIIKEYLIAIKFRVNSPTQPNTYDQQNLEYLYKNAGSLKFTQSRSILPFHPQITFDS
jgi:hypothetical protein